ncbi:MAG: LysR family transcriptional regulator [Elusimicrobia bacterium]|nr:LysR family transcriptional regulator [Elusimicrobiota bacterium]MBK7545587.1 LysR family transcriptional regulator [Elusimicrobiota bacterium]
MIPFNFHHLYYFFVVAKSGSIAKATDTLLLAQPTVSAQIKAFEKFLKRPLFDRRNRKLILTEEGRLVLDYAESIFALGREMEDAVRDRLSGGAVAVQIGVATGTPRAFAQNLLETTLALAPRSTLTLKEGPLEALRGDLRDQRLDVVLSCAGVGGADREGFENHWAGRVPVHFVAAPAVARTVRRWPRDLEGAPFIVPGGSSPAYREVLELLDVWKVRPRVVAEVDDVEIARRLAVAGHGIAPLNEATINVGPKGALKILDTRGIALYESAYLITARRKHPHPTVQRLARVFSVMPGGGGPPPSLNRGEKAK